MWPEEWLRSTPIKAASRVSVADAVENLLEDFKQGLSFDVHEFADLADGRRLTLRDDRGFTTSIGGPAPSNQWRHLTLGHLEGDVLNTVLPDDDDTRRGRRSARVRRVPADPRL